MIFTYPQYRPITEKDILKRAKKLKKKELKEKRAAQNRKLWKKYFGIDAEAFNEKVQARRQKKM